MNYNIILFFSAAMMLAMPIFSYQFLGATPSHWCRVEELVQSNWTTEQIKEVAIPFLKRLNPVAPHQLPL